MSGKLRAEEGTEGPPQAEEEGGGSQTGMGTWESTKAWEDRTAPAQGAAG